MSEWLPNTLTAEFYFAEQNGPDTEPELLAMVKERMTRMLAEKLAEALASATGGAIYSPLTYTIRDADGFGGYRVAGTVQVYEFPDPASGEFRLIGGPMAEAVIKPGANPPKLYPVPLIQSYVIPTSRDPELVIYERVPGVQAYRWAGRPLL